MRYPLNRGLLTAAAAAASSLALGSSYAAADTALTGLPATTHSAIEGNEEHAESDRGTGSTAQTTGSPGILSGDQLNIGVTAPVNACGNSVNPVGAANPVRDNSCATATGKQSSQEASSVAQPPEEPAPGPPPEEPDGPPPEEPDGPPPEEPVAKSDLASSETRSVPAEPGVAATDLAVTGPGQAMGPFALVGTSLLLGGVVLYRRGRRPASRA